MLLFSFSYRNIDGGDLSIIGIVRPVIVFDVDVDGWNYLHDVSSDWVGGNIQVAVS